MLHLAIIGIVCAVSALTESTTFIGRKNYESNIFCHIGEGEENVAKVYSPIVYNVEVHNSSDCAEHRKITNRTNSFFYDFIIQQYRNKSSSCSIMESVGTKSQSNVGIAYQKRKLLWKLSPKTLRPPIINGICDGKTPVGKQCKSKKNRCKNWRNKKNKLKKLKKKYTTKVVITTPMPSCEIKVGKCDLDCKTKKMFFSLKNLKRKGRIKKTLTPIEIGGGSDTKYSKKLYRESTLENPKKIAPKESFDSFFDENSEIKFPLFSHFKKFRSEKDNLSNRKRNTNYSPNLVSVNVGKEPITDTRINIFSTKRKPVRFRRNLDNSYSFIDSPVFSYRKNLIAHPYPYSANFKVKRNFFYPQINPKFFPRKRHFPVRSGLDGSKNWPFYRKYNFENYSKRLKRFEGSNSTNSSTKEVTESKETNSTDCEVLGKKCETSTKPMNTEENLTQKEETELMSFSFSTESIYSSSISPDENTSPPDHTLEKPFLERDLKEETQKLDSNFETSEPDYSMMTEYPFPSSTSLHQSGKFELRDDELLSPGRYLKIRHALRNYLIHNNAWSPSTKLFPFGRRKRCGGKSCSAPHKCWRSAPLLCLPYIKKGQEDVLKFLIKFLQKMIGKPLPPKADIFEKTKFKPCLDKDMESTPSDDECETTTVCPTTPLCCPTPEPCTFPTITMPSTCPPTCPPTCPITTPPTCPPTCPTTTPATCPPTCPPTTPLTCPPTCPPAFPAMTTPCPVSFRPSPSFTCNWPTCPPPKSIFGGQKPFLGSDSTPKEFKYPELNSCSTGFPFAIPHMEPNLDQSQNHCNPEDTTGVPHLLNQFSSTSIYHAPFVPTMPLPVNNYAPNLQPQVAVKTTPMNVLSNVYPSNTPVVPTRVQPRANIPPPVVPSSTMNPCSSFISNSPDIRGQNLPNSAVPYNGASECATVGYEYSQTIQQKPIQATTYPAPNNQNKPPRLHCDACFENSELRPPDIQDELQWLSTTTSTRIEETSSSIEETSTPTEETSSSLEETSSSQDTETPTTEKELFSSERFSDFSDFERESKSKSELRKNLLELDDKKEFHYDEYTIQPQTSSTNTNLEKNYKRLFRMRHNRRLSKPSYRSYLRNIYPSYDYYTYDKYSLSKPDEVRTYRDYGIPMPPNFSRRIRKFRNTTPLNSLIRRKREGDDYFWPEKFDSYSDYMDDDPRFNNENSREHLGIEKMSDDECPEPSGTPPSYEMFSELAKAVVENNTDVSDYAQTVTVPVYRTEYITTSPVPTPAPQNLTINLFLPPQLTQSTTEVTTSSKEVTSKSEPVTESTTSRSISFSTVQPEKTSLSTDTSTLPTTEVVSSTTKPPPSNTSTIVLEIKLPTTASPTAEPKSALLSNETSHTFTSKSTPEESYSSQVTTKKTHEEDYTFPFTTKSSLGKNHTFTTKGDLEEDYSSTTTTKSTHEEDYTFPFTTKRTQEKTHSSPFTTKSAVEEDHSSTITTKSSLGIKPSSPFTTKGALEEDHSSTITTKSTNEEDYTFPFTTKRTQEKTHSSPFTTKSAVEENHSSPITSKSTQGKTHSSSFPTKSPAEENHSYSITAKTTEKEDNTSSITTTSTTEEESTTPSTTKSSPRFYTVRPKVVLPSNETSSISPLKANETESINPINANIKSSNRDRAIDSKKSGKTSFFQTNSKSIQNGMENAFLTTARNSKKDLEREDEYFEADQDLDSVEESQTPTTVKMASIVKGPKKLLTKPSPKVYSKVYPDSLAFEFEMNDTVTTTAATTKASLENQTALLSSTSAPDIRLQLLAVCEGYLEVVKLIKAQNQTIGEDLDADLARYCENIISQSFNCQLDKPRKAESTESSSPNTIQTTESPTNSSNHTINSNSTLTSYASAKEFSDAQLRDKIVEDILNNPAFRNVEKRKNKKNHTEINTIETQATDTEQNERDDLEFLSKNEETDEELLKKGMTKEQIEMINLLKKRKKALLSWLLNSKEGKSEDSQETEYFEDEDLFAPDSDSVQYSGTIKPKKDDKSFESTEKNFSYANESIFPVYAKQYGYDKGGELREVEVLWRKVNEKTHEEKILKNLSVLALLLTSTDSPKANREDTRLVGNNGYENEEISEAESKSENKVRFAAAGVAGNYDKTTTPLNNHTENSTTTPALNSTTTTVAGSTAKSDNNATHTFISKPDPSTIVGAPPNVTKPHRNTTQKSSHKMDVAKDIFQEYSIEFLNYAVYILPIMFTVLFLFCVVCCVLHILKTKKSIKRLKKKKKMPISTDETSETTEESEPESKKRKWGKRKRKSKTNTDDENWDEKKGKKFWNVLKLPTKSSKEFNDENNQTEKKRSFLRFLKTKKDEGKAGGTSSPLHELDEYSKNYPDSGEGKTNGSEESQEVTKKKKKEEEKQKSDDPSEAAERRELIALLEELKKIETENTGEKKEVKSVHVQYMTQEDETPGFQKSNVFYPYQKFGMPENYSFYNKPFPVRKIDPNLLRDYELYEDVNELTELLPCECGYYGKKNDFRRHCDLRINHEGRCERYLKIYRDSGTSRDKYIRDKNQSENRGFTYNKYKSLNTDTSEEYVGVTKNNVGTEVRFTDDSSPYKLASKAGAVMVEEMDNFKRQLKRKKYVRLKDDGVLCRL